MPTHLVKVAGRDVILCGEKEKTEISDNEWLILACRDFASEEEARSFGSTLKAALELAAVATGVGIDTGDDRADLMIHEAFKDHYFRKEGRQLRDGVHGLDVFMDNVPTSFMQANIKGQLLIDPEPLLSNLGALFEDASEPSERIRTAFLLLNSAGILVDPIAQVVVAIAAVEFLSQEEKWTLDQKRILEIAREAVGNCRLGTPTERQEVCEAINKLYRLSVRQSVRRLLSSLDLSRLNETWDELYGDRSSLFHGARPEVLNRVGDLAHRSQSLCRQILLKALALEVPAIGKIVDSAVD